MQATAFRAAETFDVRRTDWRYGNLVYQIFVDRFAPSSRLEMKMEQYALPRRLRQWSDLPEREGYLHDHHISQGELDFWGGDLESVRERLDYLQELGVEVVYFNPIFTAFSNHKYDAVDFRNVDPQYGSVKELRDLCTEIHRRGMKLVLDGVFNHVGRRFPLFQKALEDPRAPERDYFVMGKEFKNGYRGWRNVANLPELNLENPAVRELLWEGEDSIVRSYLRDIDIDGWRLDVAPDIGFEYLRAITGAAHETKEESCVIGECWNYPEEWLRCVDGIMNMHARTILVELTAGKMSARAALRAIERMIEDAGIDGILKSHFVLDNHDLPRLTFTIPDGKRRRLVRALQFMLPGCPVIYYGSELGMEGGADPTNRGPMRWDLHNGENEELAFVRKMVELRKENAAIRIGDFRALDSERLFAFLRVTDKARETVLVLANFSEEEVHDVIPVRDSRLMDAAPMECLLEGEQVVLHCGLIEFTVPPLGVRVFRTVDQGKTPGYSMFKRAG